MTKLSETDKRFRQQPTDDMVQCPACQGQGVVKKWPGDRSPDRDCKYCDGVGGVTEDRFHAYHDRG
jgi:DnaJ-class molecular chaperone